jgi:DNA-binding NarL/FixJ family response regulator
VNLLLVDSSTIFRMGLRAALAAAPEATGLTVIAECGEGRQARELALALVPDVVITDLNLPDLNGIALTRELARAVPTVRVLMLAGHGPAAIVHQAVGAGVAGYALKAQPAAEIVAAIAAVGRGELVLPPGIAVPAAGRGERNGASHSIERLSQRERQIFDLVVWGSSNKQIAGRLGISIKTVETHRGHINGKLSVHTSADIVRLASLWGMLASGASGPVTAAVDGLPQ